MILLSFVSLAVFIYSFLVCTGDIKVTSRLPLVGILFVVLMAASGSLAVITFVIAATKTYYGL